MDTEYIFDERKQKAIMLLIENSRNKTEIANIVGVSRQTIYDWLKDERFVAELDSVLQSCKSYGEKNIKANLNKYINNLDMLANESKSEKIKLEANIYLINRVLGNTTSKIDLVAEARYSNDIDEDILEQAINEIEDGNEVSDM